MEFKLHCWDCGKLISPNNVTFTREEVSPTTGERGVICHACWKERLADNKRPIPIQVRKKETENELTKSNRRKESQPYQANGKV